MRGELRGKAGVYDNADNDTDRCRGDSNASCLLTADEHGVPYVLPRRALGVDDVQHENNRDGICRRAHQRHTGNDEIHQNDRRKQEIYAREDWLNVKALRFNIIGIFPGDKVNNEENGKVICQRRNNGRLGDFHIVHAEHLCHNERTNTHDGRHDLSAGRCHCLDSARLFRRIANLFHHRDGHDAGRGHVADGRAAHHAEEAGGNDSSLRRAAMAFAEFEADLNKELTAPQVENSAPKIMK